MRGKADVSSLLGDSGGADIHVSADAHDLLPLQTQVDRVSGVQGEIQVATDRMANDMSMV